MYCYLPVPVISSRERITFLKKNSDLFIYIASLLSLPTGLNTLSEPAKSTKYELLKNGVQRGRHWGNSWRRTP
jgi:hypothetical protein